MVVRSELSESQYVNEWLKQFKPEDQSITISMLEKMLLVSSSDFRAGLETIVQELLNKEDISAGLYAEREIDSKLFDECDGGVRRAYGKSRSFGKSEIGSEGIVAQIITGLCRNNENRLLNHPGPDEIRNRRMRNFILLTDFIGSGKRASKYLNAAWGVSSVRSWWSLGLLRFNVVAYTATSLGQRVVKKHPCNPEVYIVSGCPDIKSLPEDLRKRIQKLCKKYNPIKEANPLGFGGIGTLVAFEHGIPNNTPNIFHKKTKTWNPLFPNRVTSSVLESFRDKSRPSERERLFLTLAALIRKPRFDESLSRKTGLTILEIRRCIEIAQEVVWIDNQRRLTDSGYKELAYERKKSVSEKTIESPEQELYYPKLLRGPL